MTGLNHREQRALRAIERALTLDDPALAGVLAAPIPAEPTADASITDAPGNAPVSAASVGAAPVDVGARFVRRLADGFVVVVVALIVAGLVLPDNGMIVGGCLVLLMMPITVCLVSAALRRGDRSAGGR